MTGRRPHRSDDLIEAVRRLCYLSDTLRAADVLDALDGGSDE